MNSRNVRRVIGGVIGILLIAGAVSQAADLNKAIAGTEDRKKAAENGLKQIKAKGQPTEPVRRAYIDAAGKQNEWLDAITGVIENGSTTPPNVSAAAESAANSLIEWVNLRNRALGLDELKGAVADSVKKSVVQDLVNIANESWKRNRSANEKTRGTAATALKERLRWRAFDEL